MFEPMKEQHCKCNFTNQ